MASLLRHMAHTRDHLARKHNTYFYPNKAITKILQSTAPTVSQLEQHRNYLLETGAAGA